MTDFPHALPVGTRIAGYEIGRVLGQGGFGFVYEATNPDIGVRAAIKEFFPREFATRSGTDIVAAGPHAQYYPRFLDKFIEEARAIARLSHPAIIKLRHLERANGTAYIIMDYVDGQRLRDVVEARHGKLDAAAFSRAMRSSSAFS